MLGHYQFKALECVCICACVLCAFTFPWALWTEASYLIMSPFEDLNCSNRTKTHTYHGLWTGVGELYLLIANVKLLQLLIITKIIRKINITGHRPKKSGTNNQTMNQISSLIITHWKQGIEKGFSLNPALCFQLHHSTHVQRNHKYNRV